MEGFFMALSTLQFHKTLFYRHFHLFSFWWHSFGIYHQQFTKTVFIMIMLLSLLLTGVGCFALFFGSIRFFEKI